jgi:hypothetical protein
MARSGKAAVWSGFPSHPVLFHPQSRGARGAMPHADERDSTADD